MVKRLNIVNYEGEIYKIFIKDSILYINKGHEFEELTKYVLNYHIEYYEGLLWISFYDKNYSIFVATVKLSFKERIKINKYKVLEGKKYAESIDSLTMIIKDRNNINLVFRGLDNNRVNSKILSSDITLGENVSVIADNCSGNYNRPYIVSSFLDRSLILICEEYNKGRYFIYDLFDKKRIADIYLPNTCNISFSIFKNKPIIFCNKIADKNLFLKYLDLEINEDDEITIEERSLALPQNIIKPLISVYMGITYVTWNNNNVITIAKSKDLNIWKVNILNNEKNLNYIEASIMKIIENRVERLKTFITSDILKNGKVNRECESKFENNRLVNKKIFQIVIQQKNIDNKLSDLYKSIAQEERYYNKKSMEYLVKINELQKIIDEKDKIISNLLKLK